MDRFFGLSLISFLLSAAVCGQSFDIRNCGPLQDIERQLNEDTPDHLSIQQQLETYAPKITSPGCKAMSNFLRGKVYLEQGKYSPAQVQFKTALNQFQKIPERSWAAKSAYFIALSFLEAGQTSEAEIYLDQAIKLKDGLIKSDLLAEAYELRAILHSNKGEHQSAMDLLKEAVYEARQNDQALAIRLLNQISTNYQSLGETDSAIVYYERLIQLKTMSKDQIGLLSDFNTLGELYTELGHYENAQKAFIAAKENAETNRDTLSLVKVHLNIAKLYLKEELLSPALEFAEKARNLSKIQSVQLFEGQSLSLSASIFSLSNQVDSALIKYQNAFLVYEQLGLKTQMAEIQMAIAELEPTPRNLEIAEQTLRAALTTSLENFDKLGELNLKNKLCQVLLNRKSNYQEINNYLNDSENIALSTDNPSGLLEVYRLRSRYFEQTGNAAKALQQFRHYQGIKDSLLSIENTKIIRQLDKRYETEKKDKEIAEQKAALEVQNSALRKRNNQILLLLAGLVVLMILIGLVIFINLRNKQLNEQKLSILKKEREAQVLRAMVTGEEQERIRIARDLHDSLGAVIATAKMRISTLSEEIPEIRNIESYQKTGALIDDAYQNIREVTHNMMPGAISKYGLEGAIANLCEAMEQGQAIEIDFIPYGLDEIAADIVETNVYRIVQELLRNVIKHAEAKEIIVQLTVEDGQLHIIVEDDGKGFNPKSSKTMQGIGLDSIRSRVSHLNGTFEIDSRIGEGSTFTIQLPVEYKKQVL